MYILYRLNEIFGFIYTPVYHFLIFTQNIAYNILYKEGRKKTEKKPAEDNVLCEILLPKSGVRHGTHTPKIPSISNSNQ